MQRTSYVDILGFCRSFAQKVANSLLHIISKDETCMSINKGSLFVKTRFVGHFVTQEVANLPGSHKFETQFPETHK